MICTDYPVKALSILLDKDCLPASYAPLIKHKQALLSELPRLGCKRKSEAERLSDGAYEAIGMQTQEIRLLRRFLTLYDAKPQKLRELEKLTAEPEAMAAYRELYLLPGVNQIRADLYYRSGFASLAAFAEATVEAVLEKTAQTIADNALSCIVPLPKEIRTHIAVAKAFIAE